MVLYDIVGQSLNVLVYVLLGGLFADYHSGGVEVVAGHALVPRKQVDTAAEWSILRANRWKKSIYAAGRNS